MLLTSRETSLEPHDFLTAAGDVFTTFDERTQDSGNVSYGVATAGRRFFVKTAGSPDASKPFLSHDARVELLRNAARLHKRVEHPVLVPLRNIIESPHGPMLVFDWVPGELLGAPQERRSDPSTGFVRFRRLPVERILEALDDVIDLHRALASAGYIAAVASWNCLQTRCRVRFEARPRSTLLPRWHPHVHRWTAIAPLQSAPQPGASCERVHPVRFHEKPVHKKDQVETRSSESPLLKVSTCRPACRAIG